MEMKTNKPCFTFISSCEDGNPLTKALLLARFNRHIEAHQKSKHFLLRSHWARTQAPQVDGIMLQRATNQRIGLFTQIMCLSSCVRLNSWKDLHLTHLIVVNYTQTLPLLPTSTGGL